MGHSKASKARYELIKTQRASAEETARNAAPIIRDAIARQGADVLLTSNVPSIVETSNIGTRLLSENPTFLASLPSWLFEVCPDWLIVATPIKDEQTGKVTGYDTKRDVDMWDKARIKALESIRSMDFTWRKREDGSDERYIPSPCNMARLLSFVIAGNMQAVIEHAPAVVADSKVSKTRAMGFAYQNAGAAQVVDSRAYAIVIAAAALAQRTKATKNASEKYHTSYTDKARKTYDRAVENESIAQAQFDAAWRERHMLSKDILDLINPTPLVEAEQNATPDVALQDSLIATALDMAASKLA